MGDNYTIVINSRDFSSQSVIYVTEDDIYYHANGLTIGVSDGDIYFKKSGTRFRQYDYSATLNTWVTGSTIQLTDILPDFASVSSAIYNQIDDNSYDLISDSV
ncbi:MAG: hypothetical protein WCR67_02155 [Bacilli bacterium]